MKQKMLFQAVLPWIAYFNICFFWGTSTVANKLGSTSMHPLMVGAVRFTVTTLLIALAAAARGVPLRITRRDWKTLGTGSFLMYFLNTLLVLFAAVRVDASISTIVLCLIPVGLVLVDSLAQRHFDVGPPGVIGMAGGFAGVVIASASGLLGGGADIGGITLLLASVCVWSVGTIYLKNRTVEAPFILQIFVQSAVPAAAFLLTALFTGTLRPSTLNLGGVLPAVYMGVADSIIGLGSYMYLLKRWPTSVVSTYAYINPIVGLMMSHLVLHESMNAQKMAGAAVILFSVLLIREDGRLTAWLRARRRTKAG